ncbi:MAG TPA: 4Fe-4S dicluster domain-containing protein [Anaerolineae bacterium]|nr:4Fe-4S dicluster domain-containing protein [Anaerolineae bacterium]
MKQIVILSGKGGTGKTTITAALAHLASQEASIVLADLDVDAANLELVLAPRTLESHDFIGGKRAAIDPELCTACGTCAEVCRFEAVTSPSPAGRERGPGGDGYFIDPIACEGCAVCFYQCPAGAICLEEPVAGRWFRSETRFGPLFHAQLFAGEENSGKLVTLVKQQARLAALDLGADYLLLDGPPGIGCPVIAASAGADLALIVAEPTVPGIHDLERVLATTDHFGVPALVVINKHDLSPAKSQEIADYCAARDIEMVGRIPYDAVVTEAMVRGLPVTEYEDGPVSRELRRVWERVKERLD